MNKSWSLVAVIAALAFGGTLSPLQGQAPSQNLEQQIRSQYRLTHVGGNGVVVGEAGSVLIIQQDGLGAIPASYGPYWYSSFKGGRIRGSAIQHGGTVAISQKRPLQVGEKVYLLNLEINPAEIVFYVQSCGACDVSADNSNNIPFRARLAVQFDKGYQTTSDWKQIQNTLGQVFGLENAPGTSGPVPQGPMSPSVNPPGASAESSCHLCQLSSPCGPTPVER